MVSRPEESGAEPGSRAGMRETASTTTAARPGWTFMPLEHLPHPTYWPAGLGLGLTLIFWGLITSWVLWVVGLFLFALSLTGWIRDIRHERRHSSSH